MDRIDRRRKLELSKAKQLLKRIFKTTKHYAKT